MMATERDGRKEAVMSEHDLIVIGGSAGGVEALRILVAGLPHDLPAAICVVLHLSPAEPSFLHAILTRAGSLPATQVVKAEPIAPGHIYVAPPDHHLLVEQGYVRVTRGPKENRFRPAVDVLFRSAAYAYGPQVIGVIITGALDDGTAGLWAVKDRGGLAVVQDPQDAFVASMPESALRHVRVDACLPLADIAPTLVTLAAEPVPAEGGYPVSKKLAIETRIAREENALRAGILDLGQLSCYTCPECHGVLVQLQDGSLTRFRCHTGHAYSLNNLLAEVTETLEQSLGNTLRLIDEKILLLRHLAQSARDQKEFGMAEVAERKARAAEQSNELIRELLKQGEILSEDQLRHEAG
jgi:two-component system, chemotaxis family, protein-glutamate methylesterase/glutaminase